MSLVFNDGSPLTFSTCYEIITPLDVQRTTIDFSHKLDNKTWTQGKKVNSVISSKVLLTTRLALRISRDQIESLTTFLDNNYNTQFTIQADGYDLFDDNNRSGVNNVRLINHYDPPVRELINFYRIDINLVKI